MLIEQPPIIYRQLFTESIWRLPKPDAKVAYLTFDDGPIPEVTPWVLDLLDHYRVKASFFLVGDNVRRNPDLLERLRAEGHSVGNHTMHHMCGLSNGFYPFVRDIKECDALVKSNLFRPPRGLMRPSQARLLKNHYNLIMYDVVTRDYDRSLQPEQILANVKRYTRNGSIIVFHDSLKSWHNLKHALPRAIEWLRSQEYELLPITL